MSSASMSTGYYKMEKKSSEAFYTDDTGTQWYRTGDLADRVPPFMHLRVRGRTTEAIAVQVKYHERHLTELLCSC